MARIETVIPYNELATEYTAAKITATPYDYTLTDRILFYERPKVCDKFNIFDKGNSTEGYLCDALECNCVPYLEPNPNITIDESTLTTKTPADVSRLLKCFELHLGMEGDLIKYNNLIIDEDTLLEDLECETLYIKDLKNKKYLKALEVLFLLGTSKSSLIPNLMYLATKFYDRSLEDLENIKFAEEHLDRKEAPWMKQCRFYDTDPGIPTDCLLDAAIIPINFAKLPKTEYNTYSYLYNDIDNNFLLMGVIYSVIYGAELLYYLENKIKDDTLKEALEYLFTVQYTDDSFVSKFLYTYDSYGHLVINPEIKGCFFDDNELRFEAIRDMVLKYLTLPEFKEQNIAANMKFYGLPIMFGRMIVNMHAYAYQIARVKHAALVYKTAKEEGKINLEDFSEHLEDDPGLFGGAGIEDSEDVSDELLNLNDFTTNKTASDEDFAEDEKEVSKRKKEDAPTLNAADLLKKDLYDSRYDYNVNLVKHRNTDKDAYNLIAQSVKLITYELTRQIKEIKTYNTGGKQGGLLVGKLDKKNLWKYRNDPHIFYNNNYKLKEMDLAFGCILDESGSMCGENIKNGRIVMILLHEVLNSLGINHSIIGHTSNGMYQTEIYKYFQFKEEQNYSLSKPYSLVRADDRSGNCDSGALFYMQSVMKSVRNKDKIVIIFSDGQPTECTSLDLTNQVKDMERHGIHVIGVGINFSSIKEYYSDYANGRNLKEMVDIVVSILKRYVLEKKED